MRALLANPDTSLRVFQDTVSPTWEASENKHGGKFVMSFAGQDMQERVLESWSTLLAIMCTGRFHCAPEALVGAVLSSKEWGMSIAMWNRDASNAKQISRLKRKLRKLFETTSVKYLAHTERGKGRRPHTNTGPSKKKSFVMDSPLTVTKVVKPEASIVDIKIVLIVLAVFVAMGAVMISLSGGKKL